MSVKCRRLMVVATCCMLARPAFALDPLLAQRHIPLAPSANLIPGGAPCVFGSLGQPVMLAEAVGRALCSNPKTREAWADVKAQAAAVGVARAAFLPTVSGNGQLVRDSSATDISGHPQLSSDTAATVRSESMTLNWVLFDFGGRAAALRNANELFAAARATHEATLQAEFAAVAKDYFAAQATQAAVEAARDIEQMTRESMVAAQARVDRGVAPISDALQAQTQHEEARYSLAKAEGDVKSAVGAVASDMGFDPDVPVTVPAVTETARPDLAFNESVSQLIDEVKRSHPSMRAAQAQLDAALAKVDQTRDEGLPNLSLVGKYSRNSQPQSLGLGLPTYPSTGHDAYIGVQLTIPLFEGFARHYQIDQAKAQAERQQDVLDGTRQQVALDVWTGWHALSTATQNSLDSARLGEIAQRAYEAAQHRYQHGVGNILEVLNTQAALANARQKRIQALADWDNARIDLASRLGRLGMSDIVETPPGRTP
jgi:outer membrane protein